VFRTAISDKHIVSVYFGFLHPSSSIPLKLAVALLEAATDVRALVHRTEACCIFIGTPHDRFPRLFPRNAL